MNVDIVDQNVYARAVAHLRDRGVLLPTFAQLARPETMPATARSALADVDPDIADPRNLFRIHWYNAGDRRGIVPVPAHLLLPTALTGVRAPIVVALGDRFPLIRAHKVLAAYACLIPRIITGQFDPARHRAIWPSTGNYCRGGVALSRILGYRGVAILPEGMSAERFRWLEQWVTNPAEDIIRTPGSESNVKEIFDKCAELKKDPANLVLDQFTEFGNHLAHFACTGPALERIFEHVRSARPRLRPAAFVAATGSSGTLAAGEYLKDRFGTRAVAAEPIECPTMLVNGYGEHNIQGIGDKHIPFIQNVMAMDLVVAVSHDGSDALNVLFNNESGRGYLRGRRGVPDDLAESLKSLGLSGIANVIAAIKLAKYLELDESDAIFTVSTDSAELYATERERTLARRFSDGFDGLEAASTFGQYVLGAGSDHVLELGHLDRKRIFNLGYYTWVEQQGCTLSDFEARRGQDFWKRLRELVPAWDQAIAGFNARTGVTP
jgi:cysteine synthase